MFPISVYPIKIYTKIFFYYFKSKNSYTEKMKKKENKIISHDHVHVN